MFALNLNSCKFEFHDYIITSKDMFTECLYSFSHCYWAPVFPFTIAPCFM